MNLIMFNHYEYLYLLEQDHFIIWDSTNTMQALKKPMFRTLLNYKKHMPRDKQEATILLKYIE